MSNQTKVVLAATGLFFSLFLSVINYAPSGLGYAGSPANATIALLMMVVCAIILFRSHRKMFTAILLGATLVSYLFILYEVILEPKDTRVPIWLVTLSWAFFIAVIALPWILFRQESRSQKFLLSFGVIGAFVAIMALLLPALGGI